MHVSGDVHGFRNMSKAHNLGVEAHRDIDVILPGKEEKRVALRAEFAVLLHSVDLIDVLLDLCCGVAGLDDENVGAEVGNRRALRLGLGNADCSRNG